jgi:hypothetical protein
VKICHQKTLILTCILIGWCFKPIFYVDLVICSLDVLHLRTHLFIGLTRFVSKKLSYQFVKKTWNLQILHFPITLTKPNSLRRSLLTFFLKKKKRFQKYIYFIAQIEVNYENYYLVCAILISICNSNIIVIVYVKFLKK